MLSNLVNAGIDRICVLTQYKSHSLDRHISVTWRMSTILGQYVTPVPAQQRLGKHWYQGSADAIYQSLNLIYDERPSHVVLFGADHVYRIDPRQMLQAHLDTGAGVTVAGIRVPREGASAFGIIQTSDGRKIDAFLEKPEEPPGLPDDRDQSYASMGNYVFSAEALMDAVQHDAGRVAGLRIPGECGVPQDLSAHRLVLRPRPWCHEQINRRVGRAIPAARRTRP